MPRDAWPPALAATVRAAWAAIPEQDRRHLAGVTFEVLDAHELPGRLADAGEHYVRIRADLPDGLLGRAIVAHELGHIYGAHDAEVRAGHLKVEAAEAVADALVLRWLGRDAYDAIQRHRGRLR